MTHDRRLPLQGAVPWWQAPSASRCIALPTRSRPTLGVEPFESTKNELSDRHPDVGRLFVTAALPGQRFTFRWGASDRRTPLFETSSPWFWFGGPSPPSWWAMKSGRGPGRDIAGRATSVAPLRGDGHGPAVRRGERPRKLGGGVSAARSGGPPWAWAGQRPPVRKALRRQNSLSSAGLPERRTHNDEEG